MITAFLDRDGTINEKPEEGDYVTAPAGLRLLPGAADAVRALNDAGVFVVVVTNQRGIALGVMSHQDLAEVHQKLQEDLRSEAGAHVDAFFYCPHDRGTCDCRKPEPGLLLRAAERFPSIDLGHAVLVGDAASDVEAGRRAGVATRLQIGVDVASLKEAAELVLAGAL